MALAAREIYVEAMKERTSRGFKVAEQATRQMRVAESSAEIDAAGLLMERDLTHPII